MKELKRTIYFISLPLSFIGFIFPIYASSLGASAIQIGYLFSISSIVGILIRPIVGSLIDAKGRKPGILIGVTLYILVNLNYIIAKDFKYLLIAQILQALAAGFLWTSINTMISDISSKSNIGQNFGIINQTTAKGNIVGSTIGFTILFNGIFQKPFRPIFFIFLCSSLISFYYSIKEVPETISNKRELKEEGVKDKRQLICFLIIIGAMSLITSLTGPIYLLYLQNNITNDLSQISFLFVPAAILSTFLPSKFGNFSDKQGRGKTIIIGMFLNGVLQILIPFNQKYLNFLILYTFISLVVMFYSPALSSLVIDFVGEEKRGRSYGLYSFASGIGAALGPIIGSYIYEKLGNDIVFYFKGGLLIVMLVIICYIYITKLNLLEKNNLRKLN